MSIFKAPRVVRERSPMRRNTHVICRNIWCPVPFYKSVASVLKAFAVIFLSFSYPYRSLPSRPVNKYITPSFFHHDRSTVASQGTTHGIGANQFPQNYPRRQGFFQLYPKPLMDIPIQPPLPHAFYNHPCYRTLYAETLV